MPGGTERETLLSQATADPNGDEDASNSVFAVMTIT